MRETLQEKWDKLIFALEIKKSDYLTNLFSERPRPDIVYWLVSHSLIQELQIDDATVFTPLPSVGRRGPTKIQVAELQASLENFNPTEENTHLCYSYNNGPGRTEGWLKISELRSSDRYALTREELAPKQQELIEKYAPREGYKPCGYCGIQRPIQELKPHTIISRQYPNFKKVGMYCANTGCGTYDQMAHEG